MSAVDGATLAEPIMTTNRHGGTRRQAQVAARVWAEERGTIAHVGVPKIDPDTGQWVTTVIYHPWA